VGGDGEPIRLINNPDAVNVTYEELLSFLQEDDTEWYPYKENFYVCADFAETLHNNAEETGIRAAWVAVNFEGDVKGHASNAFETTDRGLIYVDCGGGRGAHPGDAIAYIKIGKEYGLIALDKAKSLEYSFYVKYVQKWREYNDRLESFNREVADYNRETSGEVYIKGSSELARIDAWKKKLDMEKEALKVLAEELGDYYYKPLGIIKTDGMGNIQSERERTGSIRYYC